MDSIPEIPANTLSSAPTTTSPSDLQHLDSYPWSSDQTFQAGLSSILETHGTSLDTPQLEELVAKARCFYFLRKYNINIDPTVYLTWRASQPTSQLSPLVPATAPTSSELPATSQASTTNGTASTPTSAAPATNSSSVPATTLSANTSTPPAPVHTPTFDEIVALIQTGQPIPGIRDIPDTVLIGQGSTSTTPARRKPWERNARTERTIDTVLETGLAGAGTAVGRRQAGESEG